MMEGKRVAVMLGNTVRKVRGSVIDRLPDLIDLAEKIGAQFDFVRVDLYSPPQGIFFGEATFYPNGGLQAFTPKEWDSEFGEPWRI